MPTDNRNVLVFPNGTNESTECIWLEISPHHTKSLLVAIYYIYKPPNTSRHLSINFNRVFKDSITNAQNEKKETIILGDLIPITGLSAIIRNLKMLRFCLPYKRLRRSLIKLALSSNHHQRPQKQIELRTLRS